MPFSPAVAAKKGAPADEPPTRINRDILALYDGAEEAAPAVTRLHKMLEMPLNHLGYRVTYWDIAKGLPDATAGRYRAIATWFLGRVTNADAYLAWAERTARAGTKFIVLESVGALGGESEMRPINAFVSHLGLEFADYYVSDTAATTVKSKNTEMIEFEQKLDAVTLAHQVVKVRSTAVRNHLVLGDPAHVWAKAPHSAVVTTGPGGGYVASNFAISYDAAADRIRWIINPFAFLREALGDQPFPIPDTTTAMGRRIYFSHIDGDGWNNATLVDRYRELGALAADVVLTELIEPYGDLPVSIGLIGSDIDPREGGHERAAILAKRAFALPFVEVASHTHSHPYAWSFYRDYSREKELLRLVEYDDPSAVLADRSLSSIIKYLQNKGQSGQINFTSGGNALPRARLHEPFDLAKEVAGALQISTSLAPQGKRARLYLWSGDTTPFEAALKATRDAGVRNMNGGDARLDTAYPSIVYVPPITKPVGDERQVYAAASNENTYTNGWTGPFDGFAALSETIANTENPRRLKPFNIYYHMFSGARPESLAAVRKNLDLARQSRIFPIAASGYAAIADSYQAVDIERVGASQWTVSNRGDIHTVRFDSADASIDDKTSIGVIGATRHAGALYVSLDPAVATARIALAKAPRTPAPVIGDRGFVADSRWQIAKFSAEPCRMSGTATGYGAGETTFGGLTPGRYRLRTTERDRGESVRDDLVVPADGALTVTLAAKGLEGLSFELECLDPPARVAVAAEPAPQSLAPPAPPRKGAKRAVAAKAQVVAAQPEPKPRKRPADKEKSDGGKPAGLGSLFKLLTP